MRETHPWTSRFDSAAAITCALIPMGLIAGSASFELLVGLVVLCWLAGAIATKRNCFANVLAHPLTWPLVLWYFAIILSLLWNGPGSKGWAHDVAIARFVLFLLALIDISGRRSLNKYLIYGLALGIAFAAINITSAYLFGQDLIGNPLIRYTGKLREAARIANLTAYAGPFFLCWS